jgi:DNA-binding CsgD family transcriptional regulator
VAKAIGAELTRIAASSDPMPARARAMLVALHSLVPYDAAWLAFADPLSSNYVSLASVGLDEPVVDFLGGPVMAHDIEVMGTDQEQPPASPSDLPYPAERLSTWTDCLIPAGFHEALTMALFTPGGRRVGFLALFSNQECPPSETSRRRLTSLAPVLARGLDPMPSLLSTARLVRSATAGKVLRSDTRTEALPGVSDDPLLRTGSPVLTTARGRLSEGQVYSSFLWPRGMWPTTGGYARVTVLAAPDDLPAILGGVVLLSPATDLRDLTPRELQVLGLVVEGCSNQEIARQLVVAPRTVAAHIEHLLVKLDATTRTLAAVRAEREGLYVPPVPWSSPADPAPGAAAR